MDGTAFVFTSPWWFLALPLALAPLLWPGRGRVLRAVALATLVAALAEPTVPAPDPRFAVLVDRSDSVGNAAVREASRLGEQGLPNGTATWAFAGDVSQVAAVDAPLPPDLRIDRSDHARALGTVLAGGAQRVLLIGDGIDTRGDVAAVPATVPIDVLPVAPRDNVRLSDLEAPVVAAPGERITLSARIHSDRAGPVTLRTRVNDQEVGEPREVELATGANAVTLGVPLPDEDEVATVRVEVEVPFEQPTGDDTLAIQIDLASRPPIAVVGDPAAAALLRGQGVPVEEFEPSDLRLPLRASALVLRAEANAFTTPQLQAIAEWVAEGGGLLMTGGEASFGLGGWYRTPVEAVLPVDSDLRSDVQVPLVAMVMVLDRSGSMAAGNPSRMQLARTGAAEVIDLAFERDLLGLVAFDDRSDWIFELRPATARGKLEMLSALRTLTPRGGTVLGPALVEAIDALKESDAAIRHVIVLSDGILYDGSEMVQARSIDLEGAAAAAQAEGISISTIAVGEQADVERLRAIARAGGGRFHTAFDVATLPRIFAGEAMTVSRSLLREDPPAPLFGTHPLIAGLAAAPPPAAYVATSLKPDAEALLRFGDEEALLAIRRHGLGRAAAFTSDLNAWSGELGAWPAFPGLFADLVRWLAARPDRFAAEVRSGPAGPELLVDAVQDGRFLDGLDLSVTVGGETRALDAVGPGRYHGALPPDAAGRTVVVSEGREVVARARVTLQDPETARMDGAAALRRLAAASGGRVLAAGEAWNPEPPGRPNPLAPYLAAAAAALLLAELAWRRFGPAFSARTPARGPVQSGARSGASAD